MSADYEEFFVPQPFWFVSEELLTSLWHAELNAIMGLFAKYPDLRKLFDAPEATVPQRTTCFDLLAHLKVIEIIDETFSGRYEESPAHSGEESNALTRSQNLVSPDAPAWVREINDVAELLPSRICHALPELLRDRVAAITDPVKGEAIRSAAGTLSTVERIQTLMQQVFDQQLQRLAARWTVAPPTVMAKGSADVAEVRQRNKRKRLRKRDMVRMNRDKLIAEIAEVAETPTEFLRLMDERKIKPSPTWNGWPGSWAQAYMNPRFRKLIHQDKSRALLRARARHSK
jgi:hypothetical protein